MKRRVVGILVVGSLALVLWILPQGAAHAKGTCYDQNKQPIPCPKSNYLLTQQAKANISPSKTPPPATDTPTTTATSTSSPTATNTPEPTEAAVPVAQAAGPTPVVEARPAPGGPTASPAANGLPSYAWLLAGAGLLLLVLIGLVRPASRIQARGVKPDLGGTAGNEAGQEGYVYPSLHTHSHDKVHEEVDTRPERHEPQ